MRSNKNKIELNLALIDSKELGKSSLLPRQREFVSNLDLIILCSSMRMLSGKLAVVKVC